MKCPHCTVEFHDEWEVLGTRIEDIDGRWVVRMTTCSRCQRCVLKLQHTAPADEWSVTSETLIRPRTSTRPPISDDVKDAFAEEYGEAALILGDSPKASAALSRRCLQRLLREKAGVKPSNLFDEIGEVLDKLPSHLAESVDAIRNIGNFAAHPNKSESTGEIVDVEPGEAEWLLDVLDGLFDFYFVQPSESTRRREALNEKLKDAGKPEML